MAIIAINGKIGAGKDTVAKIIQYLTNNTFNHLSYEYYLNEIKFEKPPHSSWQIKRFADKLKDIVCLLIGCTREQLENHEFKNTPLGEEWIRYAYTNGFWSHSDNNPSHKMMDSKECDKERYEEELRVNWQTAYKTEFTPRILLQMIGTDLFRNQILQNVWVNALFSEYNRKSYWEKRYYDEINKIGYLGNEEVFGDYPNWIIPDLRFKNEFEAIKKRNGICIRVNRDIIVPSLNESHLEFQDLGKTHQSEIDLDDADFDYEIDNNGSINDLIDKVKEILTTENII